MHVYETTLPQCNHLLNKFFRQLVVVEGNLVETWRQEIIIGLRLDNRRIVNNLTENKTEDKLWQNFESDFHLQDSCNLAQVDKESSGRTQMPGKSINEDCKPFSHKNGMAIKRK